MFVRFLKMVKFTTKQPNRIDSFSFVCLFVTLMPSVEASGLSNIHTFNVACTFTIQLGFVFSSSRRLSLDLF